MLGTDPAATLESVLDTAQDCGLNTFPEAISMMHSHYDVFFLISDYHTQIRAFTEYLNLKGLLNKGGNSVKDLTILEVKQQLRTIIMTKTQRKKAIAIAHTLEVLDTEVNLRAIVSEMNIKDNLWDRIQPWAQARWEEPSTRRGLVLVITAALSRYLPPELSPPILELGLALVGVQAMVTKG